MATDGPDPPPCDAKIFAEGGVAAIVAGVPSNAMEAWVKKVAAMSDQPVDWHFAGGRAVVKFLGDRLRVDAALEHLRPELETLQTEARRRLLE